MSKMLSETQSRPPQPWWRHRWPWLLMAGPAIVVVAGFTTYWLAASGADEVIRDGYVKEGKVITLKSSTTTRPQGQ